MAKRKPAPKPTKPAAAKKKAIPKTAAPPVRAMTSDSSDDFSGRVGTVPGDLELSVSGITFDPDPPVHDQSFTVSATVTPANASVTIEAYVNGVLRATKTGAPATFSPAELGNPAAGDTVTVVVTATAPGFTEPAIGSRRSTFV